VAERAALMCNSVQRRPSRVRTIPRMGMIERQPPVSDDHDRVRPSNYRKSRIEELVRQAEVLRCSTREGDAARLKQIEAELSLLLDAELLRLEREPDWPV
jgi:hypothetical protein